MRANLQSASTPQKSKKPERDESDELAKLFDDGTELPGSKATTGTGSTTGTTGTGSDNADVADNLPVAPARDFMKVANSIHREAVPAGLFKGKGKLIYDYLYSRTRGAVVPTRTVQATWGEIMKAANIGSDKTLRDQLKLLRAAGLVTWEWVEGSKGGSIYTVNLPEETTGTGGTGGTGSDYRYHRYFLPPVPPVLSTGGTGSLNVDTTDTYAIPKTSFKTNTEKTDDDEALADFVAVLKTAAVEVTGRGLSPAERQRWAELAELLATELKIAAGRTTVSSVPAFLTEHLRRRLWKKDAAQLRQESESSPQSKSGPPIDISQCPSCFGTGLEYPEGYDKGVRRCLHEKLSKE